MQQAQTRQARQGSDVRHSRTAGGCRPHRHRPPGIEDLNGSYSRVYLAQAGPSTAAGNFVAQVGGTWQHGSTGPLYDLVATRKGSFFTGLTRTFTTPPPATRARRRPRPSCTT